MCIDTWQFKGYCTSGLLEIPTLYRAWARFCVQAVLFGGCGVLLRIFTHSRYRFCCCAYVLSGSLKTTVESHARS